MGRFWQSTVENIVGWGYQTRKSGDSRGNSCLQRSRKTWQEYEASGGKLKLNVPANVSTEQMKVLSDNEKLMDDLGANVTPAIYYMSKENTLQQAVGLPDQKTLNIIMGNK